MKLYQKMYCIMFNAITDALNELDEMNIGKAKECLKEAQFHTEELFMSQDEEHTETNLEDEEEINKNTEESYEK